MDFSTYVRKPFQVRAVLVTEDNIEEIAKLTGTLETKDNGERYVEVDPNKVPNVAKIYVGFLLTKMDKQHRCYPPQIFKKLFVESNAELESLIKDLNRPTKSMEAKSS